MSQVSVCSWNLLAPSLHEAHPGALDWGNVRLPALRRWLKRLADAHDILCFQEAERGRLLSALYQELTPRGFVGVQTDRSETLVNATFFKKERLVLTWTDPRSRVLLCGLSFPDGRVIAVANVHLEAGQGCQQRAEAQRQAQMGSALGRMRSRRPFCSVVCGDFNSTLAEDSQLREILVECGMMQACIGGSSLMVRGFSALIDHIWSDMASEPVGVLRCPRASSSLELPDADHPSDHLPVSATMQIMPLTPRILEALWRQQQAREACQIQAAACHEWAQVLRSRDPLAGHPGSQGKAAAKAQRRLEEAFLGALSGEEAGRLRAWHSGAAEAAATMVAAAVARAEVALHREGQSEAATGATRPQGASPDADTGVVLPASRLAALCSRWLWDPGRFATDAAAETAVMNRSRSWLGG